MTTCVTERFHFISPATSDAVWNALTPAPGPVAYLYGLMIESDWRPDSTLTFGIPGGPILSGTVMYVDRPHRLSYCLSAGPGQPRLYVTWELVSHRERTVVRLYVDDVEADRGAAVDLELAWLPVIAALQVHLSDTAGLSG